MEPICLPTCAICQENLNEDNLSFSCGHSFCFSCFPYIMYNILKNTGIKASFFQNLNAEYPCLICKEGKSILPFNRLSSYFDQRKSEKLLTKAESKCEACESNISKIHCFECDQSYCDECLDHSHNSNKRFKNHRIITFNQIDKKDSSNANAL